MDRKEFAAEINRALSHLDEAEHILSNAQSQSDEDGDDRDITSDISSINSAYTSLHSWIITEEP